MSLLQQINEASSQDLASLKKAISKDSRVSRILKPGLQLSEIDNKREFIDTIKFLLLNNESVQKFVKSRSGVNDISEYFFSRLRKTKPEDVDQKWVDGVTNFVADLFKEHNTVIKGKVSRDSRRAIDDWANSNGWRRTLDSSVQKELMSLPDLRPSRPVKLYRGLLFGEGSLRQSASYDGTLEKGHGLKFLESIRAGKAEADIEWDKPSSWTTERSIAEKFAQYGPASSQMGATMQWLGRMADNKKIDGALGFVISIWAQPEDILVDVDKLSSAIHREHGSEREMIVKAGSYHAKIVKKYTVTEGEVDPKSEVVNDDDVALKAAEEFKEAVGNIVLPDNFGTATEFTGHFHLNRFMKNFPELRTLISKTSSNTITQVFEQYLNAYKSTLGALEKGALSPDKYAANPKHLALADMAKSINEKLGATVNHKSLVADGNSKGKGRLHHLSAEDARATFNDPSLDRFQRDIVKRGSFSDTYEANAFIDLGRALGFPFSGRLAQQGAAKQAVYIKQVADKFLTELGVEPPSDYKEAANEMISYLRRAHRNAAIISLIQRIRKDLKLK